MTNTATFLDKIVTAKKLEVDTLYKHHSCDELEEKARQVSAPHFRLSEALKKNGLSLIAEVKKASPSKGIIRKDFDPIQIAREFQSYGAAAISVLTEKDFFLGSPDYLSKINENSNIPLLRKDFMIDPIQVWESKLMGASAILLIKALLSKKECQDLLSLAASIGLDSIVEVHNEEELRDIMDLDDLKIIGINNRDLHSFKTDIKTATRLFNIIKTHAFTGDRPLVVAESGYNIKSDLEHLEEEAFDAVLIGEGLARNPKLIEYFNMAG